MKSFRTDSTLLVVRKLFAIQSTYYLFGDVVVVALNGLGGQTDQELVQIARLVDHLRLEEVVAQSDLVVLLAPFIQQTNRQEIDRKIELQYATEYPTTITALFIESGTYSTLPWTRVCPKRKAAAANSLWMVGFRSSS